MAEGRSRVDDSANRQTHEYRRLGVEDKNYLVSVSLSNDTINIVKWFQLYGTNLSAGYLLMNSHLVIFNLEI